MDHLGIDLSKKYFDATLLRGEAEKQRARFDNTAAGFAQLQQWLQAQKVTDLHVCMEATNIYWEKLTDYLHDKGYKVSVVNPARIKGYAMSQLRRSKTDKLDGDVIADFCRSYAQRSDEQQLRLWKPLPPEQRKLRNLVRQRADLLHLLTQHKNRLADCEDETSQACWQRLIATLDNEVATVEQLIEQHLAAHPSLQQAYTLLRSVKGLGPIAAWTILAEMPDLPHYDSAAAAAADAGLTPAHYESGDTVRRKPKTSKVGKAAIRSVLYFPALTAMRFNPVIKAFAQRLEKQGKLPMVIIVAVMRKLVHLAYGVLKHQKPFDPNYGQAKPAPS